MAKPKPAEKRGPGRPGVHVDAAARQRAYRERRKLAGLSTDLRKDLIASLRDEISRLQLGQQQVHQREDAVAAREAALERARPTPDERKVRALEFKVAELEHERQQWKFKQTDKLRELLDRRFIMRNRDLAAVFLRDYLGKPIERGHEFERATKAALEFGRKAASASSAITDLVGTLERKGQINVDEQSILTAALRILGDIHARATRIKESAKADSQRTKREEDAREKAAAEAVANAFPSLAADAMLLIHFLKDGRNYHAVELRMLRPQTITKHDLDYHLENLASDVRYALCSMVVGAIKAGENATVAAQSLRSAFDEARPGIAAEIQSVLDGLRICQVAARLVDANRRS